ncbi:MAG TPA: hypothetical protein DCR04_00870 [Flavobacteriales bacterium]|nr:hypothetical protein [Flavobacteriales bacterium]
MKNLIPFLAVALFFSACNNEPDDNNPPGGEGCQLEGISASSVVTGYGILEQLPGIWNGPVSSPTPLGSFPEWIVDFRPISTAQVSAKNELDSLNDIFMSFFVVKHDCSYKVAFRNGGGFAGLTRNSYMIIDSVDETASNSFYRFVDPVSGGNRVYTDVTFKQDSLIMVTYTNQYNTLSHPSIHMHWRASLRDASSAEASITHFNYPQKEVVRDFSTTFDDVQEAVFYSAAQDPYPEEEQPYVGTSLVFVSINSPSTIDPSKKVLIVITTQPLFSGFTFLSQNLKYRSRYVFVNSINEGAGYFFKNMHPGTYYANALYDNNGDLMFSSGDYMNLDFDREFILEPDSIVSATVNINFQIP